MGTAQTSDFLRTDLFGQHERKARLVVNRLLPLMMGIYEQDDDFSECESPLEAVFLLWWNLSERALGVIYRRTQDHIVLVQQIPVEAGGQTYRLDFAFYRSGPWFLEQRPLLAVEVDGHAFHERTPAQVRARDTRDRALHAAGIEVLHFSYSELTEQPMAAIEAVRTRLWEKLEATA